MWDANGSPLTPPEHTDITPTKSLRSLLDRYAELAQGVVAGTHHVSDLNLLHLEILFLLSNK